MAVRTAENSFRDNVTLSPVACRLNAVASDGIGLIASVQRTTCGLPTFSIDYLKSLPKNEKLLRFR